MRSQPPSPGTTNVSRSAPRPGRSRNTVGALSSIAVDAVFRPAMKRNFFGQAKQQVPLLRHQVFPCHFQAAPGGGDAASSKPQSPVTPSASSRYPVASRDRVPEPQQVAPARSSECGRPASQSRLSPWTRLNLGSDPDAPSIASPRASCQAITISFECGPTAPSQTFSPSAAIGPAAHAADRTAAGARTHNTTG